MVSSRPWSWLPDLDLPTTRLKLPDGERAKTLGQVERLCQAFTRAGLTRADLVISCGGGTVSDLVGLAAALYHRGIAVVHLPSTLLAQVDASVGKTAVNLPEGKNLVGAYWQPRGVLCDTDLLDTLPAREWRNGLGEIARCHFIGAGDLRGLGVVDQISRSVRRKAEIVAADERDHGLRHLLNYGHTLGHALETASGYRVRHGEAVAVGTVFAGRLAHLVGRIDRVRCQEHQDVVAGFGLKVALDRSHDPQHLLRLMRRDKKSSSGALSFVLDGDRGPELVHDVPDDAVLAALAAMPVDTPGPLQPAAATDLEG